jgi:hypothetical protein
MSFLSKQYLQNLRKQFSSQHWKTLQKLEGFHSFQGKEECFDKTQTVVQDAPKEQCTLEPQRTCAHVTKLVPRLEPSEECVDVPKEVGTADISSVGKI